MASPPRKTRRIPGERVTSILAVQDAALHIIDTEGLHVLSMRKLAERLGVGVMSLYRYVKTKDELLNAIAIRVLDGVMAPPTVNTAWDVAVRQMMWRLEETLHRHPEVAPLILGNVAPLSTLDPFREALLSTLNNAGLSVAQAAKAVSALLSYATGVAMIERSARTNTWLNAQTSVPDEFPHLAKARSYYDGLTPEQARQSRFQAGLDFLLSGIKAELVAE